MRGKAEMLYPHSVAIDVATRFQLDPNLILGQVQVESEGEVYAWNPEPRYRYFWDVKRNRPFRAVTNEEISSEAPPEDFPCLAGDRDQEWWAQQASWGLMQIMGAVAREVGFKNLFLPELCDPMINLSLGCTHFSRLLRWSKGDVEQALAAYNGGKAGNAIRPFRNHSYATKVLLAARKFANAH